MEFSVWINIYQYGPVLYLHDTSISSSPLKLEFFENSLNLSVKFDDMNYTFSISTTSELSVWKYLSVKLIFQNFTTVTLELNTITEIDSNTSLIPFTPGNSLVILGTDFEVSVLGFIYQVTFNNFLSPLRYTKCNYCLICPEKFSCIPECNANEYFNETSQTCFSCIDGCEEGCRDDTKCGMCFDLYCKICAGFKENSCKSCHDGYVLINKTCHECPKGTYFNYKTKKCSKCFELCTECSAIDSCSSCIEKAQLTPTICKCIKAHKILNSTCVISYFFMLLTLNFDNEVTLIFTEDLEQNLKKSDLNVSINEKEASYEIKKISNSAFKLKLDDSNIDGASYVNINISKIYSISSILFNESARALLFYTDNSQILLKVEESRTYAKTGSSVGLSISLFSGIMSLDITSVFNFMNFAEIFSVLALYGTTLPEDTSEFLISVRVQKLIPNFFAEVMGRNEQVQLDKFFSSYGFESNRMVVNSGINLMIFTILILCFIIEKAFYNNILRKIPKFDLVKNYLEYKIFIEFWLQTSCEFLITSSYSIFLCSWDTALDIIDFSFSCIMLVTFK